MDFLKSTGLGYRYTFLTLAPGRIMWKTSRGYTEGQHGAGRTLIVGGVYGALTVVKPETLLFHSSDQSLNHPVLLRGVGTDELLFQTVLVHRPSVMPRGKYQAVVTTQRDRILSPAQRAVPGNERL